MKEKVNYCNNTRGIPGRAIRKQGAVSTVQQAVDIFLCVGYGYNVMDT